MFDAVVLATSEHAKDKLLGISLVERGRRVAVKAGARRVYVIDGEAATEVLRHGIATAATPRYSSSARVTSSSTCRSSSR